MGSSFTKPFARNQWPSIFCLLLNDFRVFSLTAQGKQQKVMRKVTWKSHRAEWYARVPISSTIEPVKILLSNFRLIWIAVFVDIFCCLWNLKMLAVSNFGILNRFL